MESLVMLWLCIAAVSAVPSIMDEWSSFKALHGKKYTDPTEEYRRLGIYMDKKRKIDEHNERYRKGLVSYTLGMNHFGDMLGEEISARLNGFKRPMELIPTETHRRSPNLQALPKFVDWRKKGAVTPVKNQGDCGSCWAFSVTGTLEGHMFLKTGKLVSLSEQNLIDCAKRRYENEGCDGGLMYNGFKYIMEHGIDSEETYPYKGQDLECRFNKSNIAGSVRKYVRIDDDESLVKEVVASVGPVSVGLNADYDTFFHYKSGIYNDDDCDGNQLNHGMLIVGYGQKGRDKYWLLKNSWGTKWGEDGYMRIARDRSNICGIVSEASYPIV